MKVEKRNDGDVYVLSLQNDILDVAVDVALMLENPSLPLIKLKSAEFKECLTSEFQGYKVRVQSVFEVRIRKGQIFVQNINARGIADYQIQLKDVINSVTNNLKK